MADNVTKTENGALALASTGNGRVDLFFETVRGLEWAKLGTLLDAAWAEDQLDTVKLIFQTRDCRGGKGEKKIFYDAMQMLYTQAPATFMANLQHVPFYGTWKDLLQLCYYELADFVGETPVRNAVVELFVAQLRADVEALDAFEAEAEAAEAAGENDMDATPTGSPSISLCAKWAPSEKGYFKLMAKLIFGAYFPDSATPAADYRRMLTRLRRAIDIPEAHMCAGDWGGINYTGVPSRCMNINRKAFTAHDETRFGEFLAAVAEGKTTIKGGQMFPHELVAKYRNQALDQVLELQWDAIVDGVREGGMLERSLVLSDVSGSMSGTPMDVSIALGLLISEVTAAPFDNLVMTFHSTPTFHRVQGDTLRERIMSLAKAPWGNSTDLQACFDLILARAVENNLPAAAMPERIFIISDMQFNAADEGGNYRTNHEAIVDKYAQAGYDLPAIIYWNVRATTTSFPVDADLPNVAMIAGYSPSILESVMKVGAVSPFVMMKAAIDGERYDRITLAE